MTRRDLLRSTLIAALPGFPAAAAVEDKQRLLKGWEHYRGQLGGIWEVWRGKKASDNVTWDKVDMPHCFNAYDAVDPDNAYYQGPGWYRTTFKTENPFPNGRTLLHFEGAGQKTEVYVALEKVGQHVGGYDEFVFDITDKSKGSVPLAVFYDNSRDLEMIPSSLSDFNVYGGLYRYVNLVYVPAVSLERVLIDTTVEPGGKARVSVRARLYNPSGLKDDVKLSVQVLDPNGKSIHTVEKSLRPVAGPQDLASFTVNVPSLWSPRTPSLYRCAVTLGEMRVEERFGLRSFEFVEPRSVQAER